ncbi:helix-turn-helix domain-containing protein [Variovorax beijingensis]|uniref:Helix-turn-helix domain-containing protein n=1 Tax=Variovorax beijingensis TaxID=2496117 RepID=A0A3P3EVK9_9BURK|nr:helix-turn-helix domain-containing protein [Variovorax beijingensis]RRH90450.1 helix-turn-helix domain-containing protein [Variovorax beijingensis]RSZ34688.1 helix-turn-helix domain-containing protein [Variovorax beijingensis]
MTERVSEFGTSAALPIEEGDITHKTAGDMLREAREAHGLHIEMVAAALKVPPQKLIALEADDIASLPDPVFARALASSVCRALRIDPGPVLAKLPGAQRAALALADRTLKSNIVSGTPRWNGGRSSGLPSRALLTVVGLLLVGAAVLFWLPQSVFDQIGASVSRWTSRGGGDTSAAAEAPAAAPASGGPSVVVESAPVSPVAPPTSAAPAAPGAPSAAALPAGSATAAAAASPAAVAAAPASSQQLVFVAREECWITVTEAGGKQLLRRSLQAGETVALSGTLPLSVVVGRASAVDVQVHGKPYDLKPVTRGGGVARFEVKS